MNDTPFKSKEVPEFLDVQESPSLDVKIVPESPTTIKVFSPKWILSKSCEVPEVFENHEDPSEDVRIIPESPTATKISLL